MRRAEDPDHAVRAGRDSGDYWKFDRWRFVEGAFTFDERRGTRSKGEFRAGNVGSKYSARVTSVRGFSHG